MKILQASHNFHIVGGSDRVFFETTKLLESAGHKVLPFCMDSPDNAPSDWAEFFPVSANSTRPHARDAFRYFFNTDARQKLRALLDHAGDVDVAHMHIYHGKHTPSVLPILQGRNIPVVHSLHEYKLACPVYTLQRHGQNCQICVGGSGLGCVRHRCKDGSLMRSAVMFLESKTARAIGDVRHVDRFVCVSDFQKKIMARAGIPAEKLTRIHNFVDAPLTLAVAGHDNYFLYIGRLEKQKGIETLVRAFRQTDLHLIIAGQGAYEKEMTRLIADRENIEFVGFQSGQRLQNLIKRAQAVVVPSEWYENCPMSVLEAKALGRPVIAARIGGIPELVRDGTDGYLFEPGNVMELTAALGQLDRRDFLEISQATHADAIERFSPSAHLARLMAVYDQARATKFTVSA